MRRSTFLFIAVAVVWFLAAPGLMGHATSPPASPWGYFVSRPVVPLGQNVSVLVWGPANSTINMTWETQPFGKVPAAYGYVFNFSVNGSVGANLTTPVYRNVTVPTVGLYVGMVRLCAVNPFTVIVGCTNVTITQSDSTFIENQIAWLNLNETVLTAREQGLLYQQSNLSGNIILMFWTSVGMWGSLIFAIVFTRTGVAHRRIGRRVRTGVRKAFWKTRHVEFGHSRTPAPTGLRPDRLVVYRGRMFAKTCPQCNSDQTAGQIIAHLRSPAHGIDDPREGIDYYLFTPTLKNATVRRDDQPDMGLFRDMVDTIDVDLTQFETPRRP